MGVPGPRASLLFPLTALSGQLTTPPGPGAMTRSVPCTSRSSPLASPRRGSGFRVRMGSFAGNSRLLPNRAGRRWRPRLQGNGAPPCVTSADLSGSPTVGKKIEPRHEGGCERLPSAHAPARRPASIYVGDPTWRLRRPWRWCWIPAEHSGGERGRVRTHGGVGGDG